MIVHRTSRMATHLLSYLKSRYTLLIFVFAFGLLGYWLAPDELARGDYTAHITVTLDDRLIASKLPFRLSVEAGQLLTLTESEGDYHLVIEGRDGFAHQLSQRISYRIQVIDDGGKPVPLSLNNTTSTLIGPNYQQVLPPTRRVDDWLVFSMRIPYKARVVTALLFAVAILWLTELIPLAAAALLIPVVAVVGGVTNPTTVLRPFFHPIIVLFLAGFLMAEGMRRTGIDRLIALAILRRASLKPAYLMLTMIGITAFFSMWMSNTSSVAIIIPIALTVLDKMPQQAEKNGFRRALILGVAYAGTIGGVGSAIGTPANMLAISFLSEFTDTHLTFIDWFAYGLPLVILMVPIIWLYLLFAFRVKLNEVDATLNHDVYEQELKNLGPMNKDQKIITLVFIAVVALWLTERWHHQNTSIVALAGALILFFAEAIKKEDINHINWNALLTFGGGLSIGNLLVTTGVSDWVALQLTSLTDFPPMLVIFSVASLTLVTGAFISNTACAAMLIPMAIPLAQILRSDPRLLVAVVAIASSIDFAMVVGTPPTMIAYSTGLFKTRDIFKRGLVLDLIGVMILSFGVIWIWKLLGTVAMD